MRIHVLSDLHLEHDPDWRPPRTDADVMVLAGDILPGLRGMAKFSRQGKPVIYVPGNHEYYGENLGGLAAAMRLYAKAIGVTVLDNEEALIGGVRFLGSTLWTDFSLFGADNVRPAQDAADHHMNDYICIHSGSHGWLTPQKTAHMHALSVAWLSERLAAPFDGPTVVVTHHAPHPRSISPAHEGKLLAAAFASNLTRLMGKACLWIHGHVHHCLDYEIDGTRVVANPKGYGNENPGFKGDFVITLAANACRSRAAA